MEVSSSWGLKVEVNEVNRSVVSISTSETVFGHVNPWGLLRVIATLRYHLLPSFSSQAVDACWLTGGSSVIWKFFHAKGQLAGDPTMEEYDWAVAKRRGSPWHLTPVTSPTTLGDGRNETDTWLYTHCVEVTLATHNRCNKWSIKT